MWKFLLGMLVMFLLCHQKDVIRGYYIVIYEFNNAKRVVREGKPIVAQAWKDAEAPPIKTDTEVEEPTLDELKKLGFKVKKQ